MELNFTGRGAMLYNVEGNTAAYFEDKDTFFLIDCGEDVANKLISSNKLVKNKEYYLFITHTHSDHIGSLGTLQQYLYWVCGKKLNIIYDESVKYMKELKCILHGFGIIPDTYNLVKSDELDNKYSSFNEVRYIESNHGDVPIKSASIIFKTDLGNILYTGDIATGEVVDNFIKYSHGFIDKMYIDSSYDESPVHLSINELNKIIPNNIKNKVYCMHINNKAIVSLIKKYGFNLVNVNEFFINNNIHTMNDEELEFYERRLRESLDELLKLKDNNI